MSRWHSSANAACIPLKEGWLCCRLGELRE
jgi:hypothetical protein